MTQISDTQVRPSGCGCGTSAALARPLVYAVGKLGFEHASEARRDALTAENGGTPITTGNELALHLASHRARAALITWTLSIDEHPVYVIKPMSAYSQDVYVKLTQFLAESCVRVSVPGWITGSERLANGNVVPAIDPCLSGLVGWSAAELSKRLGKDLDDKLWGFLGRLFLELRNTGTSPQERARNFAVTEGFIVADKLRSAADKNLNLRDVSVSHSPICRPGSECWDTSLTFFNPDKLTTEPLKVLRFTVDVNDVKPVLIGGIYKMNTY
jgi:hypothetical protein